MGLLGEGLMYTIAFLVVFLLGELVLKSLDPNPVISALSNSLLDIGSADYSLRRRNRWESHPIEPEPQEYRLAVLISPEVHSSHSVAGRR